MVGNTYAPRLWCNFSFKGRVEDVVLHEHGRCAHTQSRVYGPNRMLFLAVVTFAMVTLSRFTWGFPPIYDMLVKSDAYVWLCDDAKTVNDDKLQPYKCEEQDEAINRLYTIAMSATLIASPFAGILNSFAGSKICALFGTGSLFVGILLLGLSNNDFRAYPLGAAFIGIGRDPVVFASLNSSLLFPKRELFITSFLSAAASLGTFIPTVMSIIFEKYEISFSAMMMFYAFLCAGISFLFALFFHPPKRFYTQEELDLAASFIDKSRLSEVRSENAGATEVDNLDEDKNSKNNLKYENTKFMKFMRIFGVTSGDIHLIKNSFLSPHFSIASIVFMITMFASTFYMNGATHFLDKNQRYFMGYAPPLSTFPGLVISCLLGESGSVFVLWYECISGFCVLGSLMIGGTVFGYMSVVAFGFYCAFLCAEFWIFAQETFDPSIQTFILGYLNLIGGVATFLTPFLHSIAGGKQGSAYENSLPVFFALTILNFLCVGAIHFFKRRRPKVF